MLDEIKKNIEKGETRIYLGVYPPNRKLYISYIKHSIFILLLDNNNCSYNIVSKQDLLNLKDENEFQIFINRYLNISYEL